MSATLVKPFHLAVAIQYSLIHRDIQNGREEQSLAAYFFKAMELKLKAQHLDGHTLIQADANISDFDKTMYVELAQNDFFDVHLYRRENFGFLARLLYTANFQALIDMYGEEHVKEMNLELLTQFVLDQQREALRFAKSLSFLQFIKLLDCINYQCSSMNNYKTSLCKLFIDTVSYHVVRIQPDYAAFPWDLTQEAA